ncbi:hypothetical protein MHK_001725 [Candidatus Magnetomorum sp. HK-1]|nr:hypothetical protein MHK_001725 [Candidatus Magnetomorum sp. HK-1]
MNDSSGTINTQAYLCDNSPTNSNCKWEDTRCYTQEFKGEYDSKNDIRYWNHVAKAERRCGEDIKYKRKIYRDGKLSTKKCLTGVSNCWIRPIVSVYSSNY